jgi:predicted dienelactone hydrolase
MFNPPHSFSLQLKWLPGLGLFLSLWATPGLAAEQIKLSFSSTTYTIPTRDLESFARGGQPSAQLDSFLQLVPTNSTPQVRAYLQRRLEVSPTFVTQFANTKTGRTVFRGLGELIRTQNNQNGQQALVTAFAQAAASPQGLTLLGVIRQFPEPNMQIDGDLVVSTILESGQQSTNLNQVLATIQQQAATTPATDLPTPGGNGNLENLSRPGRLPWQKVTLTLAQPQLSAQPIPVDLYLPQGLQTPAPVIVIAHGFGSDRSTFTYLAEHLASHGFGVAVPEFVSISAQGISQSLQQSDATRPVLPTSLIARPQAISLLLDQLEVKARIDPALMGKLNLQQVGLLGQSVGGYTALAVGGATLDVAGLQQSCRSLEANQIQALFDISALFQCQALLTPPGRTNFLDPRVKAVIAVNPFTNAIFGQRGMGQINLPVMIVAGTKDIFTPPLPQQIIPFSWIPAANRHKYLVILHAGTHFSLLGDSKAPSDPLPIPPELIGPDPAQARPALQALSTAFFFSYVANQSQYLPYLSQSYAQTLVQKPFRIDLVKSLTLSPQN